MRQNKDKYFFLKGESPLSRLLSPFNLGTKSSFLGSLTEDEDHQAKVCPNSFGR